MRKLIVVLLLIAGIFLVAEAGSQKASTRQNQQATAPDNQSSITTPVMFPATATSVPGPTIKTGDPEPSTQTHMLYGVYDPGSQFSQATNLQLEEVFLPWRLNNTLELSTAVRAVRQRGRIPVIGLEPWPWNIDNLTESTLLPDIANGKYDSTISLICHDLSSNNQPLTLIRWGHEMELTGRFPWSQGNPGSFVKAYQHFVDTCRNTGEHNIQFIWSPSGHVSSKDYWPGSAYVNYIGLTILTFPKFNGQDEVTEQSFSDVFGGKYSIFEEYAKPIIVFEFGASATTEQKASWLSNAFASFPDYPLLTGVILFNSTDKASLWGLPQDPDWRVSPSVYPTRDTQFLP